MSLITSGEPAVGIDLGTTFSIVSYLDSTGRPRTIPNMAGELLTPSVVLFSATGPIVGQEALNAAPLEPGRVAQYPKRSMGNDYYEKPINGKRLPPEVVQSLILKQLKEDAETKLGRFNKVVITVPAFFDEPRRKATQDAGRLAGLEVMDIINEPTAAAIAFGVQEGFLTRTGKAKQKETILVYDLGGGTFDVTVMEIDGVNYSAVATDGDVFLGGIDWDRRVADYAAAEFQTKHPAIDPRRDPAGLPMLLREADEAKRSLSLRDETTMTIEHRGARMRIPLTREQFAAMTGDLLDRTRFTVLDLMKQSGLARTDITRVLLVGGSTRMPMVREMLERELGGTIDDSLSADEAVAHGAAIYAGLLLRAKSGAKPDLRIRNVNAHSLGVLGVEELTGRSRRHVMIDRNTPLPAAKVSRFTTGRNNQKSVVVNVIEGGDASGNNATRIGKCVIRDLPPNLKAGTHVEVMFSYFQNGRLEVKARIPGLDHQAHLTIERESGLSGEAIEHWTRQLAAGKGPLKRS